MAENEYIASRRYNLMQSEIKIPRLASQQDGLRDTQLLGGRSLSLSLRVGAAAEAGGAPEEESNSSAALRKLKQIKDCKDTLGRRLSVLQIHEHRHEYKALSHQQTYAFLQQKRQEAELSRQAKAERQEAHQR